MLASAAIASATSWASGAAQNYVSGVGSGQQANFAAQQFQKRLSAIDYTLQWQNLHREDVRDLVGLTVGRMDIYHVVGTLLLTFGIQWFSTQMDSEDLEGFYTLFIMSNFCSVGYLIMSVWLAMHASIAAQAIGCRLLTSNMRLALPSKCELERISVSITPGLDRMVALGKWAEAKITSRPEQEESDRQSARKRAAMAPAAASADGAQANRGRGRPDAHRAASSADEDMAPMQRMQTAVMSRLCAAGGAAGELHLDAGWARTHSAASVLPGTGQPPQPPGREGREETAPPRHPTARRPQHEATHQSAFAEPPSGGFGREEADDVDHMLRPWESDPRRAMERRYGAAAEDCDVDRQRHFRRFLREQQHWLGYDAYSRVCMSCGLNQMLQALSYSVLGIVSAKSYPTAVGAFCGIQFLSVLILQLDMRGALRGRKEKSAVFLLLTLPPLVPACVYWSRLFAKEWQALSISPCFFLHGMWALYMFCEMRPVPLGEVGGPFVALVPQRFRAVTHLNVVKLKEDSQAPQEDVRRELEEARRSTSEYIRDRTTAEDERGSATVGDRAFAAAAVRPRLARALLAATESGVHPDELHKAERMLERLDLWERAPQILAALEALRNEHVQEYIDELQRADVEGTYREFLRRCQDLRLGLVQRPSEGAASIGAAHHHGGGPSPLAALPLEDAVRRSVRVSIFCGATPYVVWVDTETGAVDERAAPPPAGGAVSFQGALADARGLPPPSASLVSADCSAAAAEGPAEEEGGARRDSMESKSADFLPGKTVRRFSACTIAWWFLAGLAHVTIATMKLAGADVVLPDGTVVYATWPAPASAFEVSSLQCNETHLLAQGPYALYAAERRTAALGPFGRLAAAGAAPAALLCGDALGLDGARGCQELHIRDAGAGGTTASLRAASAAAGAAGDPPRVPVPPAWRLPALTCASWACGSLLLAAWDGEAVVVSSLSRAADGHEARWTLEPGFRLTPALAPRCPPIWAQRVAGCLTDAAGGAAYGGIRGLWLGPRGASLGVLASGGSFLDGWDLERGVFLGRWQLGGGAAVAACHGGQELLFARAGGLGAPPALVSVPLPLALLAPRAGAAEAAGAHNASGGKGCEGTQAVLIV
ncbi:unnamed protein product [Prorocentrum cordatum]|uniref:Uncharacterized protein n=3 Tax=Prorocentrum cordatum TaxID=2364126 RepID=A0ABN9Y7P6_9DINO|nr:unnamed protein product [Polarella glacialis]